MLADPVLPRVSRFENQRSVSSVGMRRRSAVERDVAEHVGAVVADHVVEMSHVDEPDVDELLELRGCPASARSSSMLTS